MWDFSLYQNNTVVIDDNSNLLTYKDLDYLITRFLDKIRPRCLVFILASNTIGSLLGYVSCIQGKRVALMLDHNIDLVMLNNLVLTYKPDYLWIPIYKQNDVKGCIVYSEYDYALIKTNYFHEFEIFKDLALLLTTSGSTGSPKLVRQSYKNIKANALSIAQYLKLSFRDRPITTLPMNYSYGLSVINSHLLVGATILLTNKTLIQRNFWDFMIDAAATSISGVPYTYEILNKINFFKKKLPSLSVMTQAGGRLSYELHKKFGIYAKNEGKKFIVMYGQAEATARISYLPSEFTLDKCGSIGIAIPGGKLELRDESNNLIKESYKTGELVYYGENVTLGYANSGRDLSKDDERKGVLYTGDLAKYDSDGYFFIVGRKRRFIKIFGNRVSLDELECLIKSDYYDIECACLGVDDLVYIFINNDEKQLEIKNYLSKKTKLNPSAFNVLYIDKIPKNESGKIMYHDLEKYI